MLTTPIFTRLLSTAEYGQYNVFTSWYGIAGIVVGLALTSGVHAQGLIKFSDEQALFSSSLQGLSTALVLIWALIYLLFRPLWNQLLGLPTVQVLAMLVLVWNASVFGYWANTQRVAYRYRTLVIVTLLVSLASPALEIAAILLSRDKVTARILAMVLVGLLGYSWMYAAQLKAGKALFSRRYWRYALVFNLPLVPHYLSQVVLNSADRIMIERMVGASEAGIYGLAYSLSLIMTLFNTALMQTISPWMYQKIKDRQENELAPIAYLSLVLIASVNLILILLAPEAVAIFAPKPYHEAIWIIPPVAMSVYFMYAYDLFAKFAFYHEKTRTIMLVSIGGAILNIVLNFIFIRRFGYIAAGYTTLVCYGVYTLGHYFLMNHVCSAFCEGSSPYDARILLAITLSFLVSGFALLLTYRLPLLRYGLVAAAAAAAFLLRSRITDAVRRIYSLRKAD